MQPHPSDYDPNNTTLFIGGLSSGVLTATQAFKCRSSTYYCVIDTPWSCLSVKGWPAAGVTEDDLRLLFGRFGDIVYTKIPPGKGCGFVQFVQRPAAETAMGQMQVGWCCQHLSRGRECSSCSCNASGGRRIRVRWSCCSSFRRL